MTDILDSVAADSSQRATEVRAQVLRAIDRATNGVGEFSMADLRAHLPETATGPQVGGTITALVRTGHLVWTGRFALSGNTRQRNALRPVKVYALTGPLPQAA